MDEFDGLLALSVEYKAFQAMYKTLQDGILFGLSDITSEIFSRNLITDHNKNAIENPSTAAPLKASLLLDAVKYRIKTHTPTFSQFLEALENIPPLQYLADDLKSKRDELAEEEQKRREQTENEVNVNVLRRQGLHMPLKRALTAGSEGMVTPVPAQSDSVGISGDRFIGFSASSVSPVHSQRTLVSAFHVSPVSSSLLCMAPVQMTPDSSTSLLSGLVKTHEVVTPTVKLPVTTPPQQGIILTTQGQASPVPTQLSNSYKLYSTSPGATPYSVLNSSRLQSSESETIAGAVDDAVTPNPVTQPLFNIENGEKSAPEHATPVYLPIDHKSVVHRQFTDYDDESEDALTAEVSSKLQDMFLAGSQRHHSLDSLSSTCSHDYHSALSSLEPSDNVTPDQECNRKHSKESMVNIGAGPKLQRTISCEKCLKREIVEKQKQKERIKKAFDEQQQRGFDEQDYAKLQLENDNLKRLSNHREKAHLRETSELESKIFELQQLLKQREQADAELHRHYLCYKDLYEKAQLEANNVKLYAFDKIRRLETEQKLFVECVTCKSQFYVTPQNYTM